MLQAERQDLLGLLEDSNNPEQRESCRSVAKWIKYLLGNGRDYVLSLDDAMRNPSSEKETNPEYMEYDSEYSGLGSAGTDVSDAAR